MIRVGRLLVSELFTVGAGGWSGFPSHKHDTDRLPIESRHDETYNFRFRPDYGSGLQMLQRVDNEPGDAYHIMNGSTVLIDKGYHPCCALPGYEMYYFTILGGLSQRSLNNISNPRTKNNYTRYQALWIWWQSSNDPRHACRCAWAGVGSRLCGCRLCLPRLGRCPRLCYRRRTRMCPCYLAGWSWGARTYATAHAGAHAEHWPIKHRSVVRHLTIQRHLSECESAISIRFHR